VRRRGRDGEEEEGLGVRKVHIVIESAYIFGTHVLCFSIESRMDHGCNGSLILSCGCVHIPNRRISDVEDHIQYLSPI
jgi:hypothetical protein